MAVTLRAIWLQPVEPVTCAECGEELERFSDWKIVSYTYTGTYGSSTTQEVRCVNEDGCSHRVMLNEVLGCDEERAENYRRWLSGEELL